VPLREVLRTRNLSDNIQKLRRRMRERVEVLAGEALLHRVPAGYSFSKPFWPACTLRIALSDVVTGRPFHLRLIQPVHRAGVSRNDGLATDIG
jgi:hypothetical protein